MQCLQPALAVQLPVWMQEGRCDRALQLRQAQAQRRHRHDLVAVDCAVPLELTEVGEGELVREVASLVTLLVVLVFVEGERLGGVLVHVLLVRAINTCKRM